jgi:hypothetical protein
MNINYVLKVEDAKPVAIKKALEQAGIKVRSIQEVYKEKTEADAEETAEAAAGEK